MIFLPPLRAPKRHLTTHHCIEITNNKRRTARSRCHRRRRCCCRRSCCCGCGRSRGGCRRRRCRRRHNLAVSDSAALIGGGRVLEISARIRRPVEADQKDALVLFARNQDVPTQPCQVGRRKFVDCI